jgi:Zn-dependent protease with chaperone function
MPIRKPLVELPWAKGWLVSTKKQPGSEVPLNWMGGYIIVGGGLLAIAQTEDELANVLAHEIEHVELG